MKTIGIGQVGAGFISQTHNDSFRTIPECRVVALCDVDEERGRDFAKANGIPKFYKSFKAMLKNPEVQAVSLGVPNHLHAALAVAAAEAGKHVICEKPLALSLADADRMIETCERKGVVLGYAEELCYLPKYVRMKEICDHGGVGDLFFVKQQEKHGGPYSPWFWQAETAGGGILMDMGCHALEFCRWLAGKKRVVSVHAEMATYVHKAVTELEDHVVLSMEYEDGTSALIESSWTLKGGMISTAEAHGTAGVVYADLLQGSGLRVFSETGYPPDLTQTPPQFRGPDVRGLLSDRPEAKGWGFPEWEWLWNNGYPQEMADFIGCMLRGGTPVESGRDGRIVLEIMLAGYASAGTGRRIRLPFEPEGVAHPVDLWKHPEKYRI